MSNVKYESSAWRIEALAKAGVIITVETSTDREAGERMYCLQQLFEAIADVAETLAGDLEAAGRSAA